MGIGAQKQKKTDGSVVKRWKAVSRYFEESSKRVPVSWSIDGPIRKGEEKPGVYQSQKNRSIIPHREGVHPSGEK